MESFAEQAFSFPFESLRIIPYKKYTGAVNMALDYYFISRLDSAKTPVLRFYGWQPYCLSLGFHQNIKIADITKIDEEGYDIVRRPTGGSAIFHSEELTYSLVIPAGRIDHNNLYFSFHFILYSALRKFGYDVQLHASHNEKNYLKEAKKEFACFNRPAFTEIKYMGKKLVGSAQKIDKKAILQHGSLLIGKNQNQIINYIKEKKQNKNKYLKELNNNSTSLQEIKSGTVNELKLSKAIVDQIKVLADSRIHYRGLSDSELIQANKFLNKVTVN